jgi:multiple sugar transport system permease protein
MNSNLKASKTLKEKFKISVNNTPKTAAFVFLLILAIIYVIPILWAFVSSFKDEGELFQAGGFMVLPKTWTIKNFSNVLNPRNVQTPVYRWFLNSAFASISFSILSIIIVSMSAYAFSKLHFRGRDILFLSILFISSFPGIVNIVPIYKIMLIFNWANKPWALIFPGLAGVFNIFLVKQFMVVIPDSMIEAAKIDGAGEIRIYSHLVLPLTKPILTVIGIFSFTGNWNDFLWPSIIMKDIKNLTLTAGLQLARGTYESHVSMISAISVIAIIPMIVLYCCAEKLFVRGVSVSAGVKG